MRIYSIHSSCVSLFDFRDPVSLHKSTLRTCSIPLLDFGSHLRHTNLLFSTWCSLPLFFYFQGVIVLHFGARLSVNIDKLRFTEVTGLNAISRHTPSNHVLETSLEPSLFTQGPWLANRLSVFGILALMLALNLAYSHNLPRVVGSTKFGWTHGGIFTWPRRYKKSARPTYPPRPTAIRVYVVRRRIN
jgi:hypothetical protein